MQFFFNGVVTLDYIDNGPKEIKIIDNYDVETIGKLTFLKLSKEKKFLALYSTSFLFLYASENETVLSGYIHGSWAFQWVWPPMDVSASSSMIEGRTVYSPNNLKSTLPGKPWVEGVEGYGIGETLKIHWRQQVSGIKALLVSNGYVSGDCQYS